MWKNDTEADLMRVGGRRYRECRQRGYSSWSFITQRQRSEFVQGRFGRYSKGIFFSPILKLGNSRKAKVRIKVASNSLKDNHH